MAASVSAIRAEQGSRGARAAIGSILVGAVLAATFVVGRWSAAEPRTVQPPPPIVVQANHTAPDHNGVVKQG